MIARINLEGRPLDVECDDASGLAVDMTLVEYGQWCDARWSQPFRVSGHTATNIQMYAVRAARQAEYERRRQEDGCCRPEGPTPQGGCVHFGRCPAYDRAQQICFHYFGAST